jgi:hypothetical protein
MKKNKKEGTKRSLMTEMLARMTTIERKQRRVYRAQVS